MPLHVSLGNVAIGKGGNDVEFTHGVVQTSFVARRPHSTNATQRRADRTTVVRGIGTGNVLRIGGILRSTGLVGVGAEGALEMACGQGEQVGRDESLGQQPTPNVDATDVRMLGWVQHGTGDSSRPTCSP